MKANRRMETKTPSRAVLCPRRRVDVWYAVDEPFVVGFGAIVTPVSYFHLLWGAYRSPYPIGHAITRRIANSCNKYCDKIKRGVNDTGHILI